MSRVGTVSMKRVSTPGPDGFGPSVWAVVRRVARIALGARVLGVVAVAVLLLWLALMADALWPMAGDGRRVLGLLWGAALLLGLGWALWPRRRGEGAAMGCASRIEDALGLPDQPLLTAMTLPDAADGDDPLTAALRSRAAARADAAVSEAEPGRVAPLWLLLGPLGWVWLAWVPWIVVAVVFPTLPGIGVARFVQPGADVPPFSLTTFKVGWSPEPVVFGGDVRVVATPGGLWPEETTLVLLDDKHRPIERRAMTRVDEAYTLTLYALREPVTFHIEAHGRRTRRYTLTPTPPEPAEAAAPGDRTDPDPTAEDEGGHLQPADPATDDEVNNGGTAETDPAVSGLMDQLGNLAADLADLAAQAEQAAQDGGTLPEGLAERIEALLDDAGGLADAMEAAGGAADGEMPAELAEALGDLAAALRGLAIEGLPSAPAQEGGTAEPGSAQRWAEQAAQAARNDAARLAQGQGEAEAAIRSGLAQRNGGDAPGPFRDPAASGGYDELLGSGEDGVLPDALMQQVPPRYRDQTAAYFRRLAEDRDTTEESP